MGRLRDFFKNPLSVFVAGSSREDQLAAYVIREHGLGRSIEEILDDPYLRNRATPEQRRRLVERPDVIKAVGEHVRGAGTGS